MRKTESVSLSKDGKSVRIIDQRRLPGELIYCDLSEIRDMYDAIYTLQVRGAPAIGIFAAYSIAVLAERSNAVTLGDFTAEMQKDAEYLNFSRPTAVNLRTQLDRMLRILPKTGTVQDAREKLRNEALRIHNEDIEMNKKISEHGLKLITEHSSIMTYCNAGPLATSEYGTALGPILLGMERGYSLSAFVCETRPLLQGARLTAWELNNAGVRVNLICDNMASIAMSRHLVEAVFTGADRIARNGDTANKIGTSGLAILAKHYGIPFYVFAPSTTLDNSTLTGNDIVIEERDGKEIAELHFEKRMAPEGIGFYNPSFDVTPHELITGIITENGNIL